MLGSMFVGLLVGLLAGALTNRGESMGCFGKMFLGWIGAFLGHLLFGTWGPIIAGTAIIPAILGAMIVLAIFGDEEVSFFEKLEKRRLVTWAASF